VLSFLATAHSLSVFRGVLLFFFFTGRGGFGSSRFHKKNQQPKKPNHGGHGGFLVFGWVVGVLGVCVSTPFCGIPVGMVLDWGQNPKTQPVLWWGSFYLKRETTTVKIGWNFTFFFVGLVVPQPFPLGGGGAKTVVPQTRVVSFYPTVCFVGGGGICVLFFLGGVVFSFLFGFF